MTARRRTLAEYLRKGVALGAIPDFTCRNGYYRFVSEDEAEAGPFTGGDPILAIFVGKFGTDILKSIGTEHRRDYDHGWEAGRVWDREQVNERLTKAINGGVWELHRRLHEVPSLYDAIYKLGYRGERQFTSVFRAIVYMSDVARLEPEPIARVLDECRL